MDVLGMKLACLARLNQGLGVSQGRGPVESLPECLPDESPGCHVVGAYPSLNVGQKGLALFPGDAAEFDSPLAASIKLTVSQYIHLGLAVNPFCLNVVFRQLLKLEVPHQLLRPGGAALSARATTRTGLESFPVDVMAEPWRAAVAGTAPAKMLPGSGPLL
jgi:hypothetical protein